MEAFFGSQADIEGAAENLFSSPPCPQPLRFETLSLKTLQTVPSTQGMALQNKVESKLEKKPGYTSHHPTTTTNGGVSGYHA